MIDENHPERGHMPPLRLRADGGHPAGHQGHHGQEASGHLPGDGRGRQGSDQVSNPSQPHILHKYRNGKSLGASRFSLCEGPKKW